MIIRKITFCGSMMILMVLLTSCPYGYKYNQGFLPTTPVNLEDFNTEYDDYNMSEPTYGTTFPLLFSSNRKSLGEEYDIIVEIFELRFDRDDAAITAGRSVNYYYGSSSEFAVLFTVPGIINTQNNELGPYIIDYYSLYSNYDDKYYRKYLILYANDQSGNLDIRYTLNHNPADDSSVLFIPPEPVTFLNSDYNEAYPCLDLETNRIYYCTDRNGDFDIWYGQMDAGSYVVDVLQDTIAEVPLTRSDILSSEGDDKCPYIINDIIVFASNRAGGFGGFDLWYAKKDGTGWSAPVNFGDKVNTGADEYRPLLIPMVQFKHDLLMFSSNRPGGKGGFDLYWVGVGTLIEGHYY
jgi:hypothetical protein